MEDDIPRIDSKTSSNAGTVIKKLGVYWSQSSRQSYMQFTQNTLRSEANPYRRHKEQSVVAEPGQLWFRTAAISSRGWLGRGKYYFGNGVIAHRTEIILT